MKKLLVLISLVFVVGLVFGQDNINYNVPKDKQDKVGFLNFTLGMTSDEVFDEYEKLGYSDDKRYDYKHITDLLKIKPSKKSKISLNNDADIEYLSLRLCQLLIDDYIESETLLFNKNNYSFYLKLYFFNDKVIGGEVFNQEESDLNFYDYFDRLYNVKVKRTFKPVNFKSPTTISVVGERGVNFYDINGLNKLNDFIVENNILCDKIKNDNLDGLFN